MIPGPDQRMANRTSEQVRKQLVLRFLEGASIRKISQETRVHRDTISRILSTRRLLLVDDDEEQPVGGRRADDYQYCFDLDGSLTFSFFLHSISCTSVAAVALSP